MKSEVNESMMEVMVNAALMAMTFPNGNQYRMAMAGKLFVENVASRYGLVLKV